MTSPYDIKITKVKNALENVYLKKEDLVDELGDIILGKIVDNLTSTNSSAMLSAKQGKVLNDNKEDKSNKSSSITTDTGSTTKYPTVKAVEDYAQPIGNYLTSHQDLSNYIQKSQTSGLIKNDGSIDTNSYITINHTHNNLIPTEIPNNSDLNDYTTDGYYHFDQSSPSTLSNTPTTNPTHFKLLVSTFTVNNATTIRQFYWTDNDAKIYTRYKLGALTNWYGWYTYHNSNSNPIVSSFSSTTTDNRIPSEKLVKDSLDTKQATLVSGTNIKTINNQSILGSGNITVTAHLNGECSDGVSGGTIFNDTDGMMMYFMNEKLAYDWSDTEKIYYDYDSSNSYSSDYEIATKGDISNAIGDAITYINQ